MARLINADEWKRQLTDEYHGMLSDESLHIYEVINLIDNAPTVVATEDCISREGAINALSHGSGCGNSCRKALETIPSVPFVEVQEGESITTLYAKVKNMVDVLELTKEEKDILKQLFTKVYKRQVGDEQ